MNDEELEKLRRRFADSDSESERARRKTVLERFALAFAVIFKSRGRKSAPHVSQESANKLKKDMPTPPSA